MIKLVHPFRFARIERLRELLERDFEMAVDPNAGVSTTKLVRPDPPMLETGVILDRDPGGVRTGSFVASYASATAPQPVNTPE
ncbi:hypothetical protein [Bradyrhizobium canariense]|uniref:hypothetical protein n=1 Tax=Bradyrhizobium canariense TaxID=255045 RepID=UPI0011782D41|nr:hypothetical protein [Bradyrhizobium canariense]